MMQTSLRNVPNPGPPLPDILLDWYPSNSQDLKIADYLIFPYTIFLSSTLLVFEKRRLIYIRRFIWMMCALYLLRALCIRSTVLPAADKTCKDYPADSWWMFVKIAILNMFNMAQGCKDLVFSGHTGSVSFAIMFSLTYGRKLYVKLIGSLFGLVIIFFISYNRLHYTVDIIIGMIMAAFIFILYHYGVYLAATGAFNQCAHQFEGYESILGDRTKNLMEISQLPHSKIMFNKYLEMAFIWLDGIDLRELEERTANSSL